MLQGLQQHACRGTSQGGRALSSQRAACSMQRLKHAAPQACSASSMQRLKHAAPQACSALHAACSASSWRDAGGGAIWPCSFWQERGKHGLPARACRGDAAVAVPSGGSGICLPQGRPGGLGVRSTAGQPTAGAAAGASTATAAGTIAWPPPARRCPKAAERAQRWPAGERGGTTPWQEGLALRAMLCARCALLLSRHQVCGCGLCQFGQGLRNMAAGVGLDPCA